MSYPEIYIVDGELRGIVKQLLSPWKVKLIKDVEKADIIITAQEPICTSTPQIIIPTTENQRYLKKYNIRMANIKNNSITVSIKAQVNMVKIRIPYRPKTIIYPLNENFIHRISDTMIVLGLNLIEEYRRHINSILNPKISTFYKLVAKIPIPYTVIPETMRSKILKTIRGKNCPPNITEYIQLDALRYLLLEAIKTLTNKQPKTKIISKITITHDIDTKKGLERALKMARIEEKYNIQSIWFIPTKQYKLDKEIIQELANVGEIGSHGARHAPKLVLQPLEQVKRELEESKKTLEAIARKKVKLFRAPLLQHNKTIFEAAKQTNYAYTSTTPTIELAHPMTNSPHGSKTIYPIEINGITEIPVTILQDHQLLHIHNSCTKQAITYMIKQARLIMKLHGTPVLLIHPDYDLAEKMTVYEELLAQI
ncbi:MAG: hypothetical protein DRO18_08090 [Thermoprotei archaeon]|nr:MAG: hypothetical protein DRO18_08090 [Thermoprotei archaeon]